MTTGRAVRAACVLVAVSVMATSAWRAAIAAVLLIIAFHVSEEKK